MISIHDSCSCVRSNYQPLQVDITCQIYLPDLSAYCRTPSVGSSPMWPSTTRMPAAARGKSLCLGLDSSNFVGPQGFVLSTGIQVVQVIVKAKSCIEIPKPWHFFPAQVGKSDVPETLTMAWPQELPRSLDSGWCKAQGMQGHVSHVCQSPTCYKLFVLPRQLASR